MRQVRQVGGVIVQVDSRGKVIWCDDWGTLVQLAFRGFTTVKLGPSGEIVWVGA
jgi:hypothetical protein